MAKLSTVAENLADALSRRAGGPHFGGAVPLHGEHDEQDVRGGREGELLDVLRGLHGLPQRLRHLLLLGDALREVPAQGRALRRRSGAFSGLIYFLIYDPYELNLFFGKIEPDLRKNLRDHFPEKCLLLGCQRSASVGAKFKLVVPMSLALSVSSIRCMAKKQNTVHLGTQIELSAPLARKFQNKISAHNSQGS